MSDIIEIDLKQFKDATTDPLCLTNPIARLQEDYEKKQLRLDFIILNEEELKKDDVKVGHKHFDRVVCMEHEMRCLCAAIDILKRFDKPIQLI
jgi:hypothetical protein